MNKMRSILAILLLVISTGATAHLPIEACREHLPFGTPSSIRADTTRVCHTGYAVEHDNKARIPLWVAYTLTPARILGCSPRIGDFRQDPAIADEDSARAKDYAKSGYDIGHMASSGDMRWSSEAQQESNFFSNAAPQLSGLNRGAWKQLEEQTRAWTLARNSRMLIYVGPIFNPQGATTLKNEGRVVIPAAFFKVLIDQETREVLAFIYPQAPTAQPPSTYVTSLAEVQRLTRLILPQPPQAKWSSILWASTSSSRLARTRACILEQKP